MSTGRLNEAERAEAERLVRCGLEEDLDEAGDLTSQAVLDPNATGAAVLVARQGGVIAGLAVLDVLADAVERLRVEPLRGDGPAEPGDALARLVGPLGSLFGVERLALNILARLSGVATLTARYVELVQGTRAKIYDTRKTTPGWRRLEKYAVRVGGGTNHRLGLFDGILIKDNHFAALGAVPFPIAYAVRAARSRAPGATVEVEVDSIVQLEEALVAGPDIVLLDNFTVENLGIAVEIRDLKQPGVQLEASGGIALETVGAVARTGVDRISVGALTHSAPALDLALDFVPATLPNE